MKKRLAIAGAMGAALGVVLTLAPQYLADHMQPGFPRASGYLSQIALAAQMYATEVGHGNLPDSFQTLESGLMNDRNQDPLNACMFFDPGSENRHRDDWQHESFEEFADKVDGVSDFVWVGTGKSISDPKAILAYERPIYAGTILVVYADRRTERLSMTDARRLLPDPPGPETAANR